MTEEERRLRAEIFEKVKELYQLRATEREFVAGNTTVNYGGRIYDQDEMATLVDAALDFWLTSGRFTEQFEREFAQLVGARYSLLCNSGSSANLLALSALTSPKLGERALKKGDEVITVAGGFP